MGCALKTAECDIVLSDGQRFKPRYLVSPDQKSFAPVDDLADDELIPESEVEYWERRLGVSIPKPNEIL
jgi:hypothetical protein